ncbi:Ig-like domain repeat protein [Streptomyces sp. NBC_01476]|uniref:Ig-like domain repeat protein n=1 Tax=Streptomyces sp. NBC_01476 TaxID=2903881 RepID=UPI002E34FAB6|nr:Ig-like domain repeat protein [Streptomyces sp. NBC_01476]
MRFSRTSVTTALAVLIGVTGGIGLTGTASAADGLPLDLPGYSHLLVDGPHGHLFVSGGEGSTGIAVLDFDGARVGTVAGEPGATSMALSADGGTLYVALPGSDAVSAVDTSSLTETARYRTGTSSQDDPQYLAYAAGKLWFGYGAGGQGGIGAIDAAGTVSLDGGGWYAAPTLASSPAAPDTLVAGDNYTEPSRVTVYDVSGGSPVLTATNADGGTFVQDMAITPDGKDVIVASGSPYHHQVLKLSDLSEDGQYSTSYYPDSVAVAPDGTVAAGVASGQPDIYVFPPGGTSPLHTYDVSSQGGNVDLASAALGWAPDGSRLFAVATDVYDQHPVLYVLRDPKKAGTQLTLPAPQFGYPYQPVAISGKLTSDIPLADSQAVHVTRTDPAHPAGIALPAAGVAADGSFSFTDTPQTGGTDNYTVSYAGDVSHVASTANHEIQVSRSAATVSVTTNATNYTYGATAKVTAHLGTAYNNRTVAVYAQPYGGTKKLIRTGTVDTHGNLSVNYPVTVRTSFTAAFAGDYRYAPASAPTHTVWAYARVTEAQKGYYTSGRIGTATYRIYHHKANPVTGATIAPVKKNECVAFTAQIWSSGAWRTIATANCVRTGTTSAAWATLTGTHVIGAHYRFRAEYVRPSTDPASLTTYGAWQYFLFRT